MATVWGVFPHMASRNDPRMPLPATPTNWRDYRGMKPSDVRAAEQHYIEQMRAYCLQRGSGPIRGEVISMDMGDLVGSHAEPGRFAQYMIYSSWPLVLIWLHTPFDNPAWYPQGKMMRIKLADIKLRVLNRAAKEVIA